MRLRTRPLTEVSPHQIGGLLDLCAAEPVQAVSLAHQLLRWRSWGAGDVVALGGAGRPDGGAWATGSLIVYGLAPRPSLGHAGADAAGLRAMASHARRRLTARGSVMGPREDVEAVWPLLAAAGTRAREERWEQPLLAAPVIPCDPADRDSTTVRALRRRPALAWAARGLRAAVPGEAGAVLPASVDMFRAELGYDPTDSGSSYARHVDWLVEQGRTYVLLDDGAGGPVAPGREGRIAFKTDVGALWSPVPGREGGVAQLTGVWTRPDLRGRGIGAVALAAVIDAVRRDHVGERGAVSLYVNDYNAPALALYAGLGMVRIGTVSTILL